MEMRLPESKLLHVTDLISRWLDKPGSSKRDQLSLTGNLAYASKVLTKGRSFLRRMINLVSLMPNSISVWFAYIDIIYFNLIIKSILLIIIESTLTNNFGSCCNYFHTELGN